MKAQIVEVTVSFKAYRFTEGTKQYNEAWAKAAFDAARDGGMEQLRKANWVVTGPAGGEFSHEVKDV